MRKFLSVLAIFTLSVFANFIPSKVYTTVTGVNGDTITMQNSFALNGMSGLVTRQLPSGEYALLVVKQTAPNKAVVVLCMIK